MRLAGTISRSKVTHAVAKDGLPPRDRTGARLSDRFQRSRIPALPTVLFADASEDYRSMARDALLEGRNVTDMRTVGDGNALLAYVQRAGATDGAVTPIPSLIVVDADLPGTPQGKEAVAALKADPKIKRIPVVVLGASDDPEDTASWYEVGANTYIVKPVTFLALVRLMKVFTAYWLETAELPPGQAA
jgi:two-component system response regulator